MVSLSVLVILALHPAAAWALDAIRAMLLTETGIVAFSGFHQLYSGVREVEARNLMQAYEAVLACEEGDALPLTADVWEECTVAQGILGRDRVQAERIHFLETQKAELVSELLRCSNAREPELDLGSCVEEKVLREYEQQAAELRIVQATQKTVVDQLERSQATSEQQALSMRTLTTDLETERDMNQKLSATMEQMKMVLQSAVQARDEARSKYKILKKSVTQLVAGSHEVKCEGVIKAERWSVDNGRERHA
eukprot:TRINITY_DN26539_c0_g1_i1.p1 TRINITY_DN26539_c0_g1~~TRINITY_DN26539_c0_g1_i1.p1  ORF type:complete len:252 (-),score=83.37 TRINITY_DN26539_c0_g1_i1:152-907(-)